MEVIFREIDNIRHRNLVLGFNNELTYLEKEGGDEDRIEKLKSIIESLKISNKKNKPDANKKKSSYLDVFKELEPSIYKMPWKKIAPQYQEVKVKEYIDNLSISKDKKLKIQKILLSLAKHGQLTHKIVDYNNAESKINDIKCLKKNGKKYEIDIEMLKSLK